MAPKIEELPEKAAVRNKERKNPFEVAAKKTVIRRKAEEVYETRKGLNKPQNIGTKPLDLLFQDLETKLEGGYDVLTVKELYNRFFGSQDIGVEVKSENSQEEDFKERYKVIEKLLEKLQEIQKFSNDGVQIDANLISISLHDIKTFGKLVNLIIIHGVYPALSTFKIGVPLDKRDLNNFSKVGRKPLSSERLPINSKSKSPFENIEKLLVLLYDKLLAIFQVKSDVTALLSKGTGLSDFITISIALITVPYFKKEIRVRVSQDYNNIAKLVETFELFQTYTLLLNTKPPSFFRQFVLQKLQDLHFDAPRGDGLLTLIEFVLGLREQDEIDVKRFEHVSQVVLSKPKNVSTEVYFTSIGDQCYNLLININRPMVTGCVVFVLENLWNKNQLVVRDFLMKKIWNNFIPEGINLKSQGEILVSEADLNNTINVLISMTKKGLPYDFLQALFEPILLPIWSYLNVLARLQKSNEVIIGVLISYFTFIKDHTESSTNAYGLDTIAKNLLYDTGEYKFEKGPNDLVQIVKTGVIDSSSKDSKVNAFLNELTDCCTQLTKLLSQLDEEFVQALFINVLKRYIHKGDTIGSDENPFLILIDLRVLEAIGNEFKESLARTPYEMLQIVQNFLAPNTRTQSRAEHTVISQDKDSDDEDSDDEDNYDDDIAKQSLPILLELLSAVLSESSIDLDEKCFESLKHIQKSLKRVEGTDLDSGIKNSVVALYDRIEILLNGETPVTNEHEAQNRILTRAITSLNDPLVPIRAHGLYLLRQLVDERSSVISLEFVINLHLVQLKDTDPFIYLNVIKGLESLLEWHQKETLVILISLYLNKNNDTELDERLKIGEVLLRFIQRADSSLVGEDARLILEATLSMIRRPKDDSEMEDNRLRMSSMSLLGTCCKTNPIGILDHLEDALDCAIGILQLEKDKDSAIMRRAAIVLIYDLILGTSNTKEVPFPDNYREKVVNVLRYISESDNDLLTREQAQTVLDSINELVALALEQLEEDRNDGYQPLRI
ncbi:protein required for cell viability [Scheffersomyces xylosifermentans]|uniref:protein required for cell viability n=1 Tax=Scheffersomyces xylosifermentans TaxID=1304137 RepID=UPI00315E02CD